ncbi:MAG: hypothetical protein ACRD4D_04735, partial [Candidatus Acidiferrales bacterium]
MRQILEPFQLLRAKTHYRCRRAINRSRAGSLSPELVGTALAAVVLLGGLLAAPATAQAQKGELRVLYHGEEIGREVFEISGTSTELHARGDITYRMGADTMRQTTDLLLGGDAVPRRYEWKLEEPRQKWLRMQFEGGRATISFPRDDGKDEQQVYDFGGRVALLDINVFHHFLLLARLYDFAKGGPQTVSVFVPQSVQPGSVTLELEGVETMTVDAAPQPVRRFSILSEDNRL